MVFASLHSLALTRTLVTSTGCMHGQKASQNIPTCCDSIFAIILFFEPECALVRRLEHYSVGDTCAPLSDLPKGRRTLFALSPRLSHWTRSRRLMRVPKDDPVMQFKSSSSVFACSSVFAVGHGAIASVHCAWFVRTTAPAAC